MRWYPTDWGNSRNKGHWGTVYETAREWHQQQPLQQNNFWKNGIKAKACDEAKTVPTLACSILTMPSINELLQSLPSTETINDNSTEHKYGTDSIWLSSSACKTTRMFIYMYAHHKITHQVHVFCCCKSNSNTCRSMYTVKYLWTTFRPWQAHGDTSSAKQLSLDVQRVERNAQVYRHIQCKLQTLCYIVTRNILLNGSAFQFAIRIGSIHLMNRFESIRFPKKSDRWIRPELFS